MTAKPEDDFLNSPQLWVRKARPSDVDFIKDAWIEGYRKGNLVKGMRAGVYYKTYSKVIDELLAECTTLVMVNRDNPDQKLAWGCFQAAHPPAGIIHYLYVKDPLRGNGFARALVKAYFPDGLPEVVFYTHFTGCSKFAIRHLVETDQAEEDQFVYQPFLIMDAIQFPVARNSE